MSKDLFTPLSKDIFKIIKKAFPSHPDLKDYLILLIIRDNKEFGTLEISKKMEMAPKNVISRMNELYKMDLIIKEKVSLKPKGWRRSFKLTEKGTKFLTLFISNSKKMNEIKHLTS